MSTTTMLDPPSEIASKVLRRAQVSKMTRVLQDRLALANIKIKNGWQNLSLDTIEPELEKELKRKRSNSHTDLHSDSSSISDHHISAGMFGSSPLMEQVYSDEVGRPTSSRASSKRSRPNFPQVYPSRSNSHARRETQSTRTKATWKSAHQLPQSSPIKRLQYTNPILTNINNVSFVSETSTIPNDPDSPSASEDDDSDLPVHSFQLSSSNYIASSPPRTPPPGLARSARRRAQAFNSPPSESNQAGKEGADLLLYLAASPSPAMRVNKNDMFPPSTPPAKNTPLPSSMMSTPGGQMFLGFGTPGGFNFGDFVNVTPSPAQVTWPKTPGTAKTPLVAKEGRRRLNFDALLPPTGSPNISSSRLGGKANGLGMELGGELMA